MRVGALYVYPIKSLGGVALQDAQLTPRGFAHDRRWMLVDSAGEFLTQRALPQLSRFVVRIEAGAMEVREPSGRAWQGPLALEHGPSATVRVWRHAGPAFVYEEGSAWFSNVLEREVQLVYQGDQHFRAVDAKYGAPSDQVSFADGYPYLVASTASLVELEQRAGLSLSMRRFRPNIVLEGAAPFAEDAWQRVQVGEHVFRLVKPCGRCVVTTIDPDTGATGREPLATLARFRRRDGEVMFGVNACADAVRGTVRVGDVARVLKLAEPAAPQ